MKRILIFLTAIFFVGCASSQPKIPIADAYKFDKIEYNHIQIHNPTKFTYQSKESVEAKYNEGLKSLLKKENLLNQSSKDELKISVWHRRMFGGEATPFPSDRIGGIFVSYEIKIIRDGQILRDYALNESMYDPGFFGNLKTIVGQNKDDSYENSAIDAFVRDIVKTLEELK
ncbi:hypothetical protein [Campylobacter hominis]|uniref:hypothetical protein n=1 Tax=Campylobacter hominis TaxID=76517 RepID=UPI00248B3968|nr:hypothetical protein [Campylobacter hominis]